MSLKEFQKLTNFDWADLVRMYTKKQKNFSYKVKDKDLVVVADIPYYKAVVQLLKETPPHVLLNYMGWVFTMQYAKYAGKQLQDLVFEYTKARSGVQEQLLQWKQCVGQVYSELKWAISRLFVERYLPPSIKPKAKQLVKHLKQSFMEIVNQASWLDESTRKLALEKLFAIRENVAYPEWLLNNEELDKFYGFDKSTPIQVQHGKYMDSIMELDRFAMNKMYRDLPVPVNLTLR